MSALDTTIQVTWDEGFVFSGEITRAYGRYWVNSIEITVHGEIVEDALAIDCSNGDIEQLLIDAWVARERGQGEDRQEREAFAADCERERWSDDRDDFAEDYARDAARDIYEDS